MKAKTKAIVLLSGGLDSTVTLALALQQGRECHAFSFDYSQRHRIALQSAKAIAQHYKVSHRILHIDLVAFGKSSLVSDMVIPKNRHPSEIQNGEIPSTYVPARNTLFLAYALAQAELLDAEEIYFGPNKSDIHGYPDCRPAFVEAFQKLIPVATKQSVEGRPPRLITPLLNWEKTEVIRQGMVLKVPLEKTMSCYDPPKKGYHCGICDACILRKEGFLKSHIADPTRYAEKAKKTPSLKTPEN